MRYDYDLIIIGGGPGGYCCAIRAAQLGLKVACVEKRPGYGGTCLNVGCIPSKALLHASHCYHSANHHYANMGIIAKPRLDLKAMMDYKNSVIDENVKGIAFLLRKNKIDAIIGSAHLTAADTVAVTPSSGSSATKTLRGRHIILATGSEPRFPKGIDCDEKYIVSSTGALSLTHVPKRMIVVGGGYIGLELGSVWMRLGSEVTVIEYLDHIAAGMDREIAAQLHKVLAAQGMRFRLSTALASATIKNGVVDVETTPANAEESPPNDPNAKLQADIVLIATGRQPCTKGLGLEALGIALDRHGRILTDPSYATNIAGIYAIGDVTAGPMLAHKAEDEGVALAESIASGTPPPAHNLIPGVIYTAPEAASIGATEEDLKAQARPYRKGVFPFIGNPRARIIAMPQGIAKILADADNDRILGVHILAAEAGTMIAEAVTAMEFGAAAEDIARTCHPHPTLSEAIREAALAVDDRALHI